MIRYLLDANTAIYAMIDRNSRVVQRIELSTPGEIGISAISFAEVMLGVHNQKPPEPETLKAFIAAIPIVAFDEPAARTYARLPFRRARFDRLLAAHALSIDAVVVTNNDADFADVQGLRFENWTL